MHAPVECDLQLMHVQLILPAHLVHASVTSSWQWSLHE